MSNPILQQLTPQNKPNQQNNLQNIAVQLQQFQRTLQGKDPRQIVLNMVSQGLLSNNNLQQLLNVAQQLAGRL